MLQTLILVVCCLLPSAVAFSNHDVTAVTCSRVTRMRTRAFLPSTSWLRAAAADEAEDPSSSLFLAKPPPPPPPFQPKSLAMILSAGLFLFPNAVAAAHRPMAQALLAAAQTAMRADPVLTMELGQTMETGGVYASTFARNDSDGVQQLVLQFQIEGGNAWAQGIAYGIQPSSGDGGGGVVQLVSLQIANMDASMSGTSYEVPLPTTPPSS